MEMVLPVYEHATSTIFYNACVVAAAEAVVSHLPARVCDVVVWDPSSRCVKFLRRSQAWCFKRFILNCAKLMLRNART